MKTLISLSVIAATMLSFASCTSTMDEELQSYNNTNNATEYSEPSEAQVALVAIGTALSNPEIANMGDEEIEKIYGPIFESGRDLTNEESEFLVRWLLSSMEWE